MDWLAAFTIHFTLFSVSRCCGHFTLEPKFQPLLFEQRFGCPGNFFIHAEKNPVEKFEHGHLCSEPSPYRAQFDSNVAAADDNEVFWDFGICKGLGARANPITLQCNPWEIRWFAACGDENPAAL